MQDRLILEVTGSVAHIVLNHPAAGNRFDNDMTAALIGFIKTLTGRARIIVISANGDDFCLGRAPSGPRSGDALDRRESGEGIFESYAAIRNSPLPVIGLIQGRAFGFGCAIAASCDITLADEDATFALPEMAHHVMPANAMSALMGRMPTKVIAFLAYSTDAIAAADALAAGLLSKVVTKGSLGSTADALVARLLAMPQPSLEGIKEYLSTAPELSSKGSVQFARNLHATINSSHAVQALQK